MSEKHLATGSQEPPRVEGLLRVYSNKFCPYAHRPRLVLKAKGIPHDIVNLDLYHKPEWYAKINSAGKAPALLDGSKIITESLDICDYIDEKYPQHPLYPADPEAKKKDKEFIKKIESPTSLYFKCCFAKTNEIAPEEWAKLFLESLQVFEDELARRGTTFYGGETPMMLDYMLWPFAERSRSVSLALGTRLPLGKNDLPLLRKWKADMKKTPVCAELFIEPDRFWKITSCKSTGKEPQYDTV